MTVDINDFSLTGTANGALAPLTKEKILPIFCAAASAPLQRQDPSPAVRSGPSTPGF